MSLPYRSHASPEKPSPPGEFVYAPSGNRAFNLPLALLALTFAACFGGSALFVLVGELRLLLVLGAYGYVFFRAVRGRKDTVLAARVDGSSIVLKRSGAETRVPVKHVFAVELEHKEKAHGIVRYDGPGLGQIRVADGGTIHVSRIVLSLKGGETFPLSSTFHETGATAAAAGKLRLWLRAHGWLPKEERVRPLGRGGLGGQLS